MLPLTFAPVVFSLFSWLGSRGVKSSNVQDTHTGRKVVSPELSAFIEEMMQQHEIPGLTLGAVHSNGEVEHAAWGKKDEDGTKLTPDTLFTLASCSKAFLSSTVGIVIDDFANGRNVTPLPPGLNVFNWDTKVVDILPDDWQLADEWATAKANIRDILSHVSGLPRHDYSATPTDSRLDIIRRMRYLRPAFELRAHWNYNNLMYMLGSHIVSKYSGKPYTEYIKERIFKPLNMTSTTFSPSEAAKSGKTTQNWINFGRRIPWWFTDDMVDLNSGPGGVISSVIDMTQWLKALLNSGVNPGTNATVIPKSAFDETTTAQVLITGKAPPSAPYVSLSGYGLGWFRESYKGHEVVSHSGGIPGISTRVVFLPSDDLGIVILANADQKDSAETAIIYRAIEDFLGIPRSNVEVPQDKPKSVSTPSIEVSTEELEAYAGTYFNAGYGRDNLTLCATTTESEHCKQVAQDLAPFSDEKFSSKLFAALPTLWSSHLRLRYEGNDTFKAEITYLFPEGYGRDKTPFETWEEGEVGATVRFSVDDGGKEILGFGLFDTADGLTDRQKKGGSIEETADVWFEKVE